MIIINNTRTAFDGYSYNEGDNAPGWLRVSILRGAKRVQPNATAELANGDNQRLQVGLTFSGTPTSLPFLFVPNVAARSVEPDSGATYPIDQPVVVSVVNGNDDANAVFADGESSFVTLVSIDEDLDTYLQLGGMSPLAQGGPVGAGPSPEQIAAIAQQALGVVSALLGSIAMAYGQPSIALAASTGLSGMVAGFFSDPTQPPGLTIGEVKGAITQVLEQQEAERFAATVRAASEWFSSYAKLATHSVRVTGGLMRNHFIDLNFPEDVTARLLESIENWSEDGSGQLTGALDQLRQRPNVRRWALKEYLLGLLLYLRFRQIRLWGWHREGKLHLDDITRLIQSSQAFRDSLPECETGFRSVRKSVVAKYRLFSEEEASYIEDKNKMNVEQQVPDYSGYLAKGIQLRWLGPERWITRDVDHWLEAFIADLRTIRL